jgi:peptide/nickel transport system substrate-binding protein
MEGAMRAACFLALSLCAATPCSAGADERTLVWAYQSDVATLDPHALNETFTLGFLGNVYEGLTRRGADLRIEPALAESWEMVEPTRWHFHLRRGVRFHDGAAFTAADVLFSAERARKGDVKARLAGVDAIEKVDDHTVDVVTATPQPLLIAEWDTWYIMDEDWARRTGAAEPGGVRQGGQSPAAREANGTGAFRIVERQADVGTTAERNAGWWGKREGNLDRVVFRPVALDATRVAALLAGEVDLAYPLPLQDLDRVRATPGLRVLVAPEVRTVFLGMDQARGELLYSDVRGANPLRDRRVRLALYEAIDVAAIQAKIMRGAVTPVASLVAPGVEGFPDGLERYPYDPATARALLAEAGYPEGFALGLDCPNDRYVNDDAICQAVAAMLARVGVRVSLNIQPRALFFAKVLGQGG